MKKSARDGGSAGCGFCRVVSRESAAAIVFADAVSLAFLDFRPLFPGHCLLIPKQHFETLSDLPKELIGPLFSNAQILAAAIQQTMEADGTFVAMNNIISQSVPHFHIHIVPRRKGDGLRGFFWPRHKYANEEEMSSVQKGLIAQLKK
ncbi:MAG: HIT family protein [Candidatus Acidiferrales bacterium]